MQRKCRMKMSGRRLRGILLAGLAGMAGCGAPPGDASRAPDDAAFESAPRDIDGSDIDNNTSEADGDRDLAAGAVPPEIDSGHHDSLNPSPPESVGPDDSPSEFEPQSAAPDDVRAPPAAPDDSGAFRPLNPIAPSAVPRTGPPSPGSGSPGIRMTPSVPPPPHGGPQFESPPNADQGFVLEKVYYGTDRQPEASPRDRWASYETAVRRFQILLVVGLALCGTVFFVPQRRVLVIIPAVLCLIGSAWCGRQALLEHQSAERDDASQNRRYGNDIHFENGRHQLERGYCWVSVPVNVHERGSGELEEPGLFEVQADPEKHFVLQRVQHVDRTSFLQDLRTAVQNSAAKHAFVFIHGYNVLFREAALRTAQLRYDLDFDGPAAFFSWPSNGSILSYASDEETVNLTERSGVLHEFLTDFINETGAESIHLIAHSMGNRLMTRAFEKLPNKMNRQGHKTISQLIMAAPDVNPAEFMLLADRIRELTRARTLYASEKDIALIGSEVIRMSNYTRLGQGGQSRVIVDGVQTIDASDLSREMFDLGHSYYVHPLVMKDLKHLLNTAEISPLRPWLMSVDDYWIFRDD